jgi:hypothetical protein
LVIDARAYYYSSGQTAAHGTSTNPLLLLLLSLPVVALLLILQAAGRPVHRTAFTRGAADGSLLFNPFDFTLKNVANTGVLNWGGRLLALYEVRGWGAALCLGRHLVLVWVW